MVQAENGAYEGMLFDMAEAVEYFIEAAGVRSASFNLKVVELPYVKKLDLEYRFPPTRASQPRKIEDGGDMAMLRGTDVRVHHPADDGGEERADCVMNDGTRPADGERRRHARRQLHRGPGRLLSHRARRPRRRESRRRRRSTRSTCWPTSAPTVTIAKPGRDTDAHAGRRSSSSRRAPTTTTRVKNLRAGLPGQRRAGEGDCRSSAARSRRPKSLPATRSIWKSSASSRATPCRTTRAPPTTTVDGAKQATSDIYFLRIRPFGKDFKPATSMGGGGGGGGGGRPKSARCRSSSGRSSPAPSTCSATSKTMGAAKAQGSTVVLALSQSKLREQVEGLVERMNSRLVAPDPAFKKIAELLPQAAGEMKTAEGKLQAQSAERRAAAGEQGASVPAAGGRGIRAAGADESQRRWRWWRRRRGSIAEDLANLFKVEMDKMANQYETNQRASQQSADQQIDELAEKLKELARRQEQELQRQRQMRVGSAARRGSRRHDAARARASRRKKRRGSSRNCRASRIVRTSPDAARQMQQAADAMRRAAANGDPGAAGQAKAAARSPAAKRSASCRGRRAPARSATSRTRSGRRRRSAGAEVDRQRACRTPGGRRRARREGAAARPAQGSARAEVGQLESSSIAAAGDIAREREEASRKLQEAAGQIRDDKIKEKLRYSRR